MLRSHSRENQRGCGVYDAERYDESLDNVTAAKAYEGQSHEISTRGERRERQTLRASKLHNLSAETNNPHLYPSLHSA
jgi:hypothetical protein